MAHAIQAAYGLNPKDFIYTLVAIAVIAGIAGFIYEEIFYRIDLKKWVKRGSTFGPWIPIYGIGGIFLTLIVYHFRGHWIFVFLMSCLVTGLIEFFGGYFILRFTGRRLWDYNTEIWNWGNIGGFICARSVILFGIGGVALVYLIYPIVTNVYSNPHGEAWENTMMVLFFVFILDIILAYFLRETHSISGENEEMAKPKETSKTKETPKKTETSKKRETAKKKGASKTKETSKKKGASKKKETSKKTGTSKKKETPKKMEPSKKREPSKNQK